MTGSRIFLVLALFVLVVSVVLIRLAQRPVLANDKENKTLITRTTLSNAQQLAIAFMLYAADNEYHLPLANNWEEALSPYVKSDQVFFTMRPRDSDSRFMFFEELSGVSLQQLSNLDEVPLVFESSKPMKNARGELDQIRWIDDSCAVGFLDGHAEFKPKSWRLEPVILDFTQRRLR